MEMASGGSIGCDEVNQGYQIIARVNVGPYEYVLGEHEKVPHTFATWQRTPTNDGDGPPSYYWGHYHEDRDRAIKDFCGRAQEKYLSLAKERKTSIKAKLAAKPVPGDKSAAKSKNREVR